MIVQCEQCRTKFRLDDGKVSTRGVKVRCAKCRHVFTVRKEETSLQSAGTPESSASVAEIWVADDLWAPAPATADATTAAAPDQVAQNDDLPRSGSASESGAFQPDSAVFAARESSEAGVGADFGEINFGTESAMPSSAEGSSGADPGRTGAAAGGLDFSDISFTAEPSAAPATGTDFAEMTMAMPDQKQEMDISAASVPAPPVAEDNFNLGKIDFGKERPAPPKAEQPVAAAETHASEAAPPYAAPLSDISFEAPAAKEEQEAPPLFIPSRRRRSPLLSILVTILAVLVLGAAGFMGYIYLSGDSDALNLFAKPRVQVEEGRITLRKISAAYLENAAAGELLVISGEAVNNFNKPRAALQLKGMIFGGDGTVLVSKVAYAGNILTNEQLLTMPLDKIEAAMNNQFGDSLANLEVQPGKAIPFTLVIANPPKEGREFGVEVVGSTVAASK